ncbi:hypothetical protein ASJ79_18460 [Mycobacterium sp. NAZ190054]|nr:hypothetical protein ASJ79_18460 [Mycobacterium sp. NAZ190054]
MPRRPRGILFDLDDTLLDHRGAARDALREWGRYAGLDMPAEDLEKTWYRLESHYYSRYQKGELTKVEQRRARVRDVFSPLDLSDGEADRLFDAYWNSYCRAWRAFPDAERAVRRALEAGLSVGLLTNGDAGDQRRKVEATTLKSFGLPLFASSELPSAKPDPRAFRSACTAIDVAPEECLMIGDSLINDVHGALGAGLSAVLLDRYGASEAAAQGYSVVRSLDAVPF